MVVLETKKVSLVVVYGGCGRKMGSILVYMQGHMKYVLRHGFLIFVCSQMSCVDLWPRFKV